MDILKRREETGKDVPMLLATLWKRKTMKRNKEGRQASHLLVHEPSPGARQSPRATGTAGKLWLVTEVLVAGMFS